MGYHPPKGVRPPQLEGKRTGRPKGSRNYAVGWQDVLWGFQNCGDETAKPPTAGAGLWRRFAEVYYYEVEHFLEAHGMLRE